MKRQLITISILLLIMNSFLIAFDKKDIKYLDSFKEASKIYKVELKLLLAIAKGESNFNKKATHRNKKSSSMDRGIMQVNSYWIKTLKKYEKHARIEKALFDPDYNIKVGAWILRQCINVYGQSWRAVDCYNKGQKKARDSSHYISWIWKNYQQIPNDL